MPAFDARGSRRTPCSSLSWIDGLPGYVSRERGGILQTTALAIEDGRIAAIYITRNPDKLRGLRPKPMGNV